jgi:hypothetical protein
MTLTIVSGAIAGLLHVVSGPDHLTAVAPLAISDGRRGWFAGWTWGIGHSLGVVCVAALALVLRDWLPPVEVLSHWSERIVGGALIAVGLWALRRSAAITPRAHQHGHLEHGHLHVQRGPHWLRRLGHAHASFYLGILHGVAGSSHFFGVLPALALPSRVAGLVYITAFGVGTVAAMTAFTAIVGTAGARFGPNAVVHRALMFASSVAALVVGSVWLLA